MPPFSTALDWWRPFLVGEVKVRSRSPRMLFTVFWTRNLGGRKLPKPWLIIYDFDLNSIQKSLPDFDRTSVLITIHVLGKPLLEMDEHPLEFLTLLVGALNHINSLNITKIKFSEDGTNAGFGDVLEHPWDADARLASPE